MEQKIRLDTCTVRNLQSKDFPCPPPDNGELEMLFPYEVFKMLKAEGKITDVLIENMMNWRHSGFNVYCGYAIWPHNEEGPENLASYINRVSFFSRAHDIYRSGGFIR